MQKTTAITPKITENKNKKSRKNESNNKRKTTTTTTIITAKQIQKMKPAK